MDVALDQLERTRPRPARRQMQHDVAASFFQNLNSKEKQPAKDCSCGPTSTDSA